MCDKLDQENIVRESRMHKFDVWFARGQMRVISFHCYVPNDLGLVYREIPKCKDDEILVMVIATTITRLDILRRHYKYYDPRMNPLLGMECSGEIVSMGSRVIGHRIGEKVCALTDGGSYAEFIALPLWRVLPIPNGTAVDHAAAFPYTASVVWYSLFGIVKLTKNSSVMIHDLDGEFGPLAIQLARLQDCTVFASTRFANNVRDLEVLGADFCIEYDEYFSGRVLQKNEGRDNHENFHVSFCWPPINKLILKQVALLVDPNTVKDALMDAFQGVDFIFDFSGDRLSDNLEMLSYGGTLVVIGHRHTFEVVVDQGLLANKQRNLVWNSISLTQEQIKQNLEEIVKELWPTFEREKLITPRVYKQRYWFVFVFNAFRKAERYVKNGDKVLLIAAGRPTIKKLCVIFVLNLVTFVPLYIFLLKK